MKASTKLISAAVAAAALCVIAAPASASVFVTFATTGGDENGATILNWTQGAGGVGGALASDALVNLHINNDLATAGTANIATMLVFDAADTTNATIQQGQFQQWHLDGNFQFEAVNAGVYGGIAYSAGETLLRADFHNAKLSGTGNGGTANDSPNSLTGAVVDYSSPILIKSGGFTLDTFSFTLSTPGQFKATGCSTSNPDGSPCTSGLQNFNATATGAFSAAVPEPATWALMIFGFGGAGAMLRRRRMTAVAA